MFIVLKYSGRKLATVYTLASKDRTRYRRFSIVAK